MLKNLYSCSWALSDQCELLLHTADGLPLFSSVCGVLKQPLLCRTVDSLPTFEVYGLLLACRCTAQSWALSREEWSVPQGDHCGFHCALFFSAEQGTGEREGALDSQSPPRHVHTFSPPCKSHAFLLTHSS